MHQVAFQGEHGAYSEKAAMKFFKKNCEPIACRDFVNVFKQVARGKTRYGILPLENALTGSIYQNFDLLLEHKVWICGEIKLRIDHNLMAVKGSRIENIKQVYSHPQALSQCESYLKKMRRVQPIPFFDTAGSAKHISEQNDHTLAAIAGEQAAKALGLKVLEKGIADNQENFTRFVVIGQVGKVRMEPRTKRAKTSVVFAFKNIPGALFKALSIFAIRDIDLAKVESRPIPGSPWEYLFYLDFYGNIGDEAVQKCLKHLEEITNMLKVLGSYDGAK